jgi:hypothetical protein
MVFVFTSEREIEKGCKVANARCSKRDHRAPILFRQFPQTFSYSTNRLLEAKQGVGRRRRREALLLLRRHRHYFSRERANVSTSLGEAYVCAACCLIDSVRDRSFQGLSPGRKLLHTAAANTNHALRCDAMRCDAFLPRDDEQPSQVASGGSAIRCFVVVVETGVVCLFESDRTCYRSSLTENNQRPGRGGAVCGPGHVGDLLDGWIFTTTAPR